MLRVYVTIQGVSCVAVGRKLLASIQTLRTKTAVHSQPGKNGKQCHKMPVEKNSGLSGWDWLVLFPPFEATNEKSQ